MPLTPVLHSIYKGWLRQAARKAALSPIVATQWYILLANGIPGDTGYLCSQMGMSYVAG